MRGFIERLAYPESGFDVEHAVQRRDMDKAIFEKRTESADVPPTKVLFGPFCLLPTQFLLLEGDKPVTLGSRALEILIALVGRRGELVSKQDLTARVWPNLLVEPSNLTVHMSALRRALRDGQDGNRFIINIPRRGYCFVAAVAVSGGIEPDGDENRAAWGVGIHRKHR
jgi:DNA-binding winged helix-turn-helix (wHTH) protein